MEGIEIKRKEDRIGGGETERGKASERGAPSRAAPAQTGRRSLSLSLSRIPALCKFPLQVEAVALYQCEGCERSR